MINLKASRSLDQKVKTVLEIQKMLNISRFPGVITIFLVVIWKSIPCSTFVPNHTSKARLVCFLRKY